MSYRDYSGIPLDEEELAILQLNYKYVKCGNLPPKKEYYDGDEFRDAYRYCCNRLDELKRDVKADYRPNLVSKKNDGFFIRLKNRKGIALTKSFAYHYKYIWNTLNTGAKDYLKKYEEYIGTDFEYELLAFMTTITGACISGKKNGEYLLTQIMEFIDSQYGWYHLNDNLINERCSIYSYVIDNNTARAEWLLGTASPNQILNTFITFGDFLYNPECAKDYFNAPMLIGDMFELSKYVATIKKVQSIVFGYIDELRKL